VEAPAQAAAAEEAEPNEARMRELMTELVHRRMLLREQRAHGCAACAACREACAGRAEVGEGEIEVGPSMFVVPRPEQRCTKCGAQRTETNWPPPRHRSKNTNQIRESAICRTCTNAYIRQWRERRRT
jgi:hypothetical protein